MSLLENLDALYKNDYFFKNGIGHPFPKGLEISPTNRKLSKILQPQLSQTNIGLNSNKKKLQLFFFLLLQIKKQTRTLYMKFRLFQTHASNSKYLGLMNPLS